MNWQELIGFVARVKRNLEFDFTHSIQVAYKDV